MLIVRSTLCNEKDVLFHILSLKRLDGFSLI